jgi:formylglycine-generating enzyme required for sulfatase activity
VLRLAEELVLRRATLSEYCQAMEESGDRGELATLAYLDYQRTAQAKGRRFSFRTATVDLKGKITATASGSAVQFFERLVSGVYLEIVSIPGGIFQMGAPETENGRSPDEGPVHPVSVKSFYLGKYPITQRQWQVVAGWPRQRIDLNPDPSRFKGPLRPVENVSWFEAVEFCERLSSRTGRQYRLPTEAEWEYACRAGTTTPFSFGATINPELVNYDGNNPYGEAPKGRYRQATVDVGQLGYANSFGLYDMHGNVWEWVEDVWHNSYEEAPRDGSAWLSGGNQEGRVLRGGSWIVYGNYCRSAYRVNYSPDSRYVNNGFRVVMGERTP